MTEKTKIRIVEEPKRQELVQATYGIVGCMLEVYRRLGGGLCKAVEHIDGFKPFVVDEGVSEFSFEEGTETDIPTLIDKQYTFEY